MNFQLQWYTNKHHTQHQHLGSHQHQYTQLVITDNLTYASQDFRQAHRHYNYDHA